MAQANQQLNTLELISQNKALFNPYKDVYDRPDTMSGLIVERKIPSLMGYIMNFRRKLIGDNQGYSTVKTRKFLSMEINTVKNPNRFTTVGGGTNGAPGATVNATIKAPYGINGNKTVPLAKHMALADINGETVHAYIKSVTTTTAGAYVLELTPINGGSIDLSGGDINWLYNPRISYDNSCSSSIQTEAFQFLAPDIVRGNIQEFETGNFICQNDLTHYGLETSPEKLQVFDQLTGKMVDTYCMLPAVQEMISNKMIYADVLDLLFKKYDGVNDRDFDGLFETATQRGSFNMQLNTRNVSAFISTIEVVMLNLKIQGCMEATVFCDQEMMSNVNRMLAQIPATSQFGLPIFEGDNKGVIDWYSFKGIKGVAGVKGLNIQFEVIEGWEQADFTDVKQNFGILVPSMSFRDQFGNAKPPIEIVKLASCTGLKASGENNMWNNDMWYSTVDLTNGGRKLNVFARTSFGVRFWGAKFMGIFRGEGC